MIELPKEQAKKIRYSAAEFANVEQIIPDYRGRFFTRGFAFVTNFPTYLGAAIAIEYIKANFDLDIDSDDLLEGVAPLLPTRQDQLGKSRVYY